MNGFTTHIKADTNQLNLHIPDELKGIELQIIILPANKENVDIEFFSESELNKIQPVQPEISLIDHEDYTK